MIETSGLDAAVLGQMSVAAESMVLEFVVLTKCFYELCGARNGLWR